MLEFKVTLDTDEDILTITGPTTLKVIERVWSIEDMTEAFKRYMLTFCQKVHYGNYRIDAINSKDKVVYVLSKDIEGTRSEWINIGTFARYYDAYQAMRTLMEEEYGIK